MVDLRPRPLQPPPRRSTTESTARRPRPAFSRVCFRVPRVLQVAFCPERAHLRRSARRPQVRPASLVTRPTRRMLYRCQPALRRRRRRTTTTARHMRPDRRRCLPDGRLSRLNNRSSSRRRRGGPPRRIKVKIKVKVKITDSSSSSPVSSRRHLRKADGNLPPPRTARRPASTPLRTRTRTRRRRRLSNNRAMATTTKVNLLSSSPLGRKVRAAVTEDKAPVSLLGTEVRRTVSRSPVNKVMGSSSPHTEDKDKVSTRTVRAPTRTLPLLRSPRALTSVPETRLRRRRRMARTRIWVRTRVGGRHTRKCLVSRKFRSTRSRTRRRTRRRGRNRSRHTRATEPGSSRVGPFKT